VKIIDVDIQSESETTNSVAHPKPLTQSLLLQVPEGIPNPKPLTQSLLLQVPEGIPAFRKVPQEHNRDYSRRARDYNNENQNGFPSPWYRMGTEWQRIW